MGRGDPRGEYQDGVTQGMQWLRAVAGPFDFRLGTDADVPRHRRLCVRRAGMDADQVGEAEDKIELKGSPILAAIKASGIEYILSVPDIVTSGGRCDRRARS